jgi:hypothetical protein
MRGGADDAGKRMQFAIDRTRSTQCYHVVASGVTSYTPRHLLRPNHWTQQEQTQGAMGRKWPILRLRSFPYLFQYDLFALVGSAWYNFLSPVHLAEGVSGH